MKHALLLAAGLALASPAASHPNPVSSGAGVIETCSSKKDFFEGMCFGFVYGLAALAVNRGWACFRDVPDLPEQVVRIIRADRNLMRAPGTEATMTAIRQIFACR